MTLRSRDLNIFPESRSRGKTVLRRQLCRDLLPLNPSGGLWGGSYSKTSGWLQAGVGKKRADGLVSPNILMQRGRQEYRSEGATAGTLGKAQSLTWAWEQGRGLRADDRGRSGLERDILVRPVGQGGGWHTNETQLGELQDHPVFRGLLECKVFHGAQVVGLGYDVVFQLHSGG